MPVRRGAPVAASCGRFCPGDDLGPGGPRHAERSARLLAKLKDQAVAHSRSLSSHGLDRPLFDY
jgi:hypothetical protein